MIGQRHLSLIYKIKVSLTPSITNHNLSETKNFFILNIPRGHRIAVLNITRTHRISILNVSRTHRIRPLVVSRSHRIRILSQRRSRYPNNQKRGQTPDQSGHTSHRIWTIIQPGGNYPLSLYILRHDPWINIRTDLKRPTSIPVHIRIYLGSET